MTPDGQRSMNTFLGATRGITPDDIDERAVAASKVLYIEGYLWDEPGAKAAIEKAMAAIKQAGGKVDAQALAGGIWEAMITTGVGLAVAIPILLLLHLLEGMADRRALAMRRCASLILESRSYRGEADTDEPVHHRAGVVYAV